MRKWRGYSQAVDREIRHLLLLITGSQLPAFDALVDNCVDEPATSNSPVTARSDDSLCEGSPLMLHSSMQVTGEEGGNMVLARYDNGMALLQSQVSSSEAATNAYQPIRIYESIAAESIHLRPEP